MKIKSLFAKIVLAFVLLFTIVLSKSYAQNNGLLPLTGIKFFNDGLAAKGITVKVDGAHLMSNRIPLNKEIEFSFQQLTGFTESTNKTMYAGGQVIVLSPQGTVLFNNPDPFIKNYANGFYANDLKTFSLKVGFGADLIKNNFNGLIKIRLFDAKGKNQLNLEFPVTFARPGERLLVSTNSQAIKSNNGANAVINGLKAKGMQIDVDTTIKVAPKMAYTSMNISNIEGSSLSEMFSGKETFWVYDSDLKEVKITDILLKKVNGALENNTVNYTLKIPYRLKTNKAKIHTVRYRWESPDKSRVIDVVVNI